MAQEFFLDKVRNFIGHIAWVIFLWSIRMNQDQYLDSVVRESGLRQRSVDVCPACAGKGINVLGIHHETCLACNGAGTR
jgi:hypothetical protein